jgi:phage recombination protein Bet
MSEVASNVVQMEKPGLVTRTGQRFGVDPNKLLATLKATAFRVERGEVTVEQMMALLVVADQYGLNPFTKELYAFPDKKGGIIPVVGVDGWCRLINENPAFDGLDFVDGPPDEIQNLPQFIDCTIHRKDRSHPITVREYMAECYRPPFEREGRKIDGPWQTHPRRMLRHKALIQAARIAMGFVGIYEEDEAQRIYEAIPARTDESGRSDTSDVDPVLTDKWVGRITDITNQDKEETAIAADLREIDAELDKFPELKQTVFDALAARGIITKANYRKYLKVGA